jgi:hypothetical protein
MRTALFWVVTQRTVVISYRRFGTTYRSRLQGSRIKETWSPNAYLLTYCLTYLVTPWEAGWFAANQEISLFFVTRRFITAFTSARHLSLSWASSIQSIPPLPEDPPMYVWVSHVVSFTQVSSPKPCIRLCCPPYALHAPPISLFSILSPEQYLVRSSDH